MLINLIKILAVLFFTVYVSACGGEYTEKPLPDYSEYKERISLMPTGFKIVGDSGVVQVDDNFYNMTYSSTFDITLNSEGKATLGMFKPGDFVAAIQSTTPIAIDKVTEVDASINLYNYYFVGIPNTTFRLYTFDSFPRPQLPGNLMVYNSSGQVTFNSNLKVMKVIGVYNLPNNRLEEYPLSIDTGVTKEYAAVLSQGRRFGIEIGRNESGVFMEGVYTTPTGFGTGEVLLKSIPIGNLTFDSFGGGQVMLIDVTGL